MDGVSDNKVASSDPGEYANTAAGQIEEILHKRSERLTSLVRITTSVVSTDDLDKVLQVIGFETARFLHFDQIAVAVVDQLKGSYKIAASVGDKHFRLAGGAAASRTGGPALAGSAIEAVVESRQRMVWSQLPDGPRATLA